MSEAMVGNFEMRANLINDKMPIEKLRARGMSGGTGI